MMASILKEHVHQTGKMVWFIYDILNSTFDNEHVIYTLFQCTSMNVIHLIGNLKVL